MKSLNKTHLENNYPEIFNEEQMEWLKEEGFVESRDDSYVGPFTREGKSDRHLHGYHTLWKSGDSDHYVINIYIFENGVGVDIDYNCGGNSSVDYWYFEDSSFEECYDKMVEFVQRNR